MTLSRTMLHAFGCASFNDVPVRYAETFVACRVLQTARSVSFAMYHSEKWTVFHGELARDGGLLFFGRSMERDSHEYEPSYKSAAA